MRLSYNVPEMRVGRECGNLIQDRFAHHGPHRLALLVVAKLEVMPDFSVADALHTLAPEGGVAEERCEFKEREAGLGEHPERIPQQFIGARSKRIEMPTLFQNLRAFRNLNKPLATALWFERIETYRKLRIGRLEDNQPLAQILARGPFLCRYSPEEKRRGIAV